MTAFALTEGKSLKDPQSDRMLEKSKDDTFKKRTEETKSLFRKFLEFFSFSESESLEGRAKSETLSNWLSERLSRVWQSFISIFFKKDEIYSDVQEKKSVKNENDLCDSGNRTVSISPL